MEKCDLAGKVAKLKIAFNATKEEMDLLLVKYASHEPELVWSEMMHDIEFSYRPVAVGTGDIPIVILELKINTKSDIFATALRTNEVH